MAEIKEKSQVKFICIALNHSYSLKGLYWPYDAEWGIPPSRDGSECSGCRQMGIKRDNFADSDSDSDSDYF